MNYLKTFEDFREEYLNEFFGFTKKTPLPVNKGPMDVEDLINTGILTQDQYDLIKSKVSKIIKPATLVVYKGGGRPQNSQLMSHFGGDPYFEVGEAWPQTKRGEYIPFICQIFNNGSIGWPSSIKLLQVFSDDFYENKLIARTAINKNKMVFIERPDLNKMSYENDVFDVAFNTISFGKRIDTLPTFNYQYSKVFESFFKDVPNLTDDHKDIIYEEIYDFYSSDESDKTLVGGYANHVQGDYLEGIQLLQIDSDENIDLRWGEDGRGHVMVKNNNIKNLSLEWASY